MEKLFESPVLLKIQEWGEKFRTNKYVASITTGMMSTMSILMVGAICQIICSIGTMMNLFTADSAIYSYLYMPYDFTMGLLGLWITAFSSYNYAKQLEMKAPLSHAIDAVVIFIMLCAPIKDGQMTTSFLSSTGVFVGFIVTFFVVRIEKFFIDKKISIKMPNGCPPALIQSFSAIIPLLVNVIIFQGLNVLLSVISAGQLTLPSAIMAILMIPLSGLTSLPGIFFICFISLVLWCFGIHGGGITYPIIMASLLEAVQTNTALHVAGEPLMFFPVFLYGAMASVGGTGNPFGLMLLCLKAKSKQLRTFSKAAIIPSWFSITEPIIFGMPIMYNPILCIPFILNTMVVMALYAIAYYTGLISPVWNLIVAILPMGLGSYLGTLNFMNLIFDYIMIIPSTIVWYPFFKMYDKQLYEKEQQEALGNL